MNDPPASGERSTSTGTRRRTMLALGVIGTAAVAYHGLSGRGSVVEGPTKFLTLTEPRRLPNIHFTADGRDTDLAQLHGKVVLLNLWATWCPPCRTEMPSLDRLQAQLGSKDFEVVALSIDAGDQGRTAVQSFYATVGIRHLKVYHDPQSLAGVTLGVIGVPTTLLLDQNGREIGRMPGAAAWDGPEALALIKRHLSSQSRS